jgi:hypothetical protein
MTDAKSHKGYQLKKGRLYYEDKIVLPKNSPLIPWVLQEFHDSASMGHSGFFRTYKRIAGLVCWKGIRKDIHNCVQACETCQRNIYQTFNPRGLLQPLPIPDQTWKDISMDFIGGLPKVAGVEIIMAVVDRLNTLILFQLSIHTQLRI